MTAYITEVNLVDAKTVELAVEADDGRTLYRAVWEEAAGIPYVSLDEAFYRDYSSSDDAIDRAISVARATMHRQPNRLPMLLRE